MIRHSTRYSLVDIPLSTIFIEWTVAHLSTTCAESITTTHNNVVLVHKCVYVYLSTWQFQIGGKCSHRRMISILHSRYHRQQQVDLFMYSEAEVSIIFQWELNSWKPYLKEMVSFTKYANFWGNNGLKISENFVN
uniref:Ovule protein n=1 Tax=Parascaris univalens TaxID=6257 RepID=A0A915ARU2_PARUN